MIGNETWDSNTGHLLEMKIDHDIKFEKHLPEMRNKETEKYTYFQGKENI